MALLDGKPGSADVWSEEDIEVLRLSPAAFDMLTRERQVIYGKLLLNLSRIAIRNLRKTNEMMRLLEYIQAQFTCVFCMASALKRVDAHRAMIIVRMGDALQARQAVRARSLLCLWAGKELCVSLTDVAKRLGISVPTVGVSIQRCGQIADREGIKISASANMKI